MGKRKFTSIFPSNLRVYVDVEAKRMSQIGMNIGFEFNKDEYIDELKRYLVSNGFEDRDALLSDISTARSLINSDHLQVLLSH